MRQQKIIGMQIRIHEQRNANPIDTVAKPQLYSDLQLQCCCIVPLGIHKKQQNGNTDLPQQTT